MHLSIASKVICRQLWIRLVRILDELDAANPPSSQQYLQTRACFLSALAAQCAQSFCLGCSFRSTEEVARCSWVCTTTMRGSEISTKPQAVLPTTFLYDFACRKTPPHLPPRAPPTCCSAFCPASFSLAAFACLSTAACWASAVSLSPRTASSSVASCFDLSSSDTRLTSVARASSASAAARRSLSCVSRTALFVVVGVGARVGRRVSEQACCFVSLLLVSWIVLSEYCWFLGLPCTSLRGLEVVNVNSFLSLLCFLIPLLE